MKNEIYDLFRVINAIDDCAAALSRYIRKDGDAPYERHKLARAREALMGLSDDLHYRVQVCEKDLGESDSVISYDDPPF
jgi:hypothetical protein